MDTQIVKNNFAKKLVDTSLYSYENSAEVRNLHESLEVYSETPLVELKNFAAKMNVKSVLVKDESKRFNLKSFKGLGGIFAIYKIISRELGLENITLQELLSEKYREKISKFVFVTTTDGNHGKGVAWASGIFGCRSFIFMPEGTVAARVKAIRDVSKFTEVTVKKMDYDACVKYSADFAKRHGYFLIQDTSFEDYEEIPQFIMRGYTTMIYETLDQMKNLGYERPTHVFLQAGVGSMAGTVCAVLSENFKENLPRISIVEPEEVACFYETMKVGDGEIHSSTGNGKTIMAGLNCATPCSIAWKIIRETATDSVKIPDSASENAIRQLYNPVGNDEKIIAGESGAAGFALVNLTAADLKIRQALEIDDSSIILVINTEGATDEENFRKIISN